MVRLLASLITCCYPYVPEQFNAFFIFYSVNSRRLISTLIISICPHLIRSAAGPDGAGAGAAPGNRRLQQTQAQVDEV